MNSKPPRFSVPPPPGVSPLGGPARGGDTAASASGHPYHAGPLRDSLRTAPVTAGFATAGTFRLPIAPPTEAEEKGIIEEIDEVSKTAWRYLFNNKERRRWHVSTVWTSWHYNSLGRIQGGKLTWRDPIWRKSTIGSDASAVLVGLPNLNEGMWADVPVALCGKFNELIEDIKGSDITRRIVASAVLGLMPRTSFFVGDWEYVNQVRDAIVEYAAIPKDQSTIRNNGLELESYYVAAITMGRLARQFWGNDEMVLGALNVVYRTIDGLKDVESFSLGGMEKLVRSVGPLVVHNNVLSPVITPFNPDLVNLRKLLEWFSAARNVDEVQRAALDSLNIIGPAIQSAQGISGTLISPGKKS